MLHTTEDFIKYQQDWPINVKKRQKVEEEKRQKEKQNDGDDEKPQKEHEWRRSRGENETHNEAHATDQQGPTGGNQGESEEGEDLQNKYSPQELSLLRLLQWESNYMKTLKENDGKRRSPVVAVK